MFIFRRNISNVVLKLYNFWTNCHYQNNLHNICMCFLTKYKILTVIFQIRTALIIVTYNFKTPTNIAYKVVDYKVLHPFSPCRCVRVCGQWRKLASASRGGCGCASPGGVRDRGVEQDVGGRGSAAPPWGHRGMPPELRFGALINEPASARASVPGVLPCVHTLAHPHTRSLKHTHMQRQCALALHTHIHNATFHHTKFAHTKKDALKGPRPSALPLHPPTPPPPPLSLSLYDATKVHGQYESP